MSVDKHKILFVDDEPNILSAFKRQLRSNYQVEIASSGKAGLELLTERGPFSVVVSDMQMSEMNGVEFLNSVREQAPETVRVMLTGKVDEGVAVQAVNESNIFRFLYKPCSIDDLELATRDAVAQYQLITAERELLQKTLSGSVKLLTDILSLIDPMSFGSNLELRQPLRAVSAELDPKNSWAIELAVMLSEIGAITLPNSVAERARTGQTLTEEEQSLVNNMPLASESLITNIPRLKSVAQIVRYVNKGYDGSGTPVDEVKGTQIPLGSRIIYAVKLMKKLEREAGSLDNAIAALRSHECGCDPNVLDVIERLFSSQGKADESPDIQSHSITTRQLCVGQKLLSDVKTKDGVLLITAGHEVSELVLGRISNYAETIGVIEPILVDVLIPTKG
ncbi:MAG: response regulator [Bdellovibrionales bacterium]|nr:response regulator [Bdellovibrionales bacterium]